LKSIPPCERKSLAWKQVWPICVQEHGGVYFTVKRIAEPENWGEKRQREFQVEEKESTQKSEKKRVANDFLMHPKAATAGEQREFGTKFRE